MQYNKQLPKNWVLLRGLMRSQFHWKNFAELLKIKLQLESVQSVELPGNGFLCHEKTPIDIFQVITQLRSQLNVSGKQPIGIIGISLGGMLATQWAQLYPQEVSHIVLINSSSSLSPFYKRLLPQNYPALIKNLILSRDAQLEKFILSTTSNNRNKWESQAQENINFLMKFPLSGLNFFRQLKLATQVDFSKKPEANKLILASKADRLVSYTCSERIAKLWNCDILYHETAGHDLPLDDADWVIEKIRGSKY